MIKTLEEFQTSFPDLEADVDFAAIVIKKRGLIAFKRPTLSATRTYMAEIKAIPADDDSDIKVDVFLKYAASCLICPTEAEFRQLIEETPNALGQIDPLLSALGQTGFELSKKASG
jgi:hypothetical protein